MNASFLVLPRLPPPSGVPRRPDGSPRALVEILRESPLFHEFRQAFEATTGLSLSLQAAGDELPPAGDFPAHPFCLLLAAGGRPCPACVAVDRTVREQANRLPATVYCHAGFAESRVPVRNGDQVVGHLRVGQVLLRTPDAAAFARALRRLGRLGVSVDTRQARAAYFRTPRVDRRRYQAMLELLHIFARHLSLLSNTLMLATHPVDLPTIARAKTFILDHLDEALTLEKVAHHANMSSCYFCKVFRRCTGLHFIEYVGRARIERVKRLLLNRQMRISEGAYAAGFTSLSQFNRTFKRVVGEEPRAWREQRVA